MAAVLDIPNFCDVDFTKWSTKPIRTNDNSSKSVLLDGPRHFGGIGCVQAVLAPDMRLVFSIRPGMAKDGEEGSNSNRLNAELEFAEGSEASHAKGREFDEWCLDQGYLGNTCAKAEDAWYSDLHSILKSQPANIGRAMLLGKFKRFVRAGATKEGKSYADTVRIKLDGWFDYIIDYVREEKTIKGKKVMMVKECVWKPRYTTKEDGVTPNPLTERDTKFYLWVDKIKRYIPQVPCVGADGKPIVLGRTPDGKPRYQMRWVGPQDAPQHSRITPVCKFTKMYVTDSFGPTVAGTDLYIKPAPPRSKSRVAGYDVDTNVSAEDALAALTETAKASEAAADDDDESEGAGAGAGAGAAVGAGGASAKPEVKPEAAVVVAAAVAVAAVAEVEVAKVEVAKVEAEAAAGERVGRKRKADRKADEDDDEESEATKPKAKKGKASRRDDDDF